MGLNEILNGEELTGKHALLIFAGWIGIVVLVGVLLAFVV